MYHVATTTLTPPLYSNQALAAANELIMSCPCYPCGCPAACNFPAWSEDEAQDNQLNTEPEQPAWQNGQAALARHASVAGERLP